MISRHKVIKNNKLYIYQTSSKLSEMREGMQRNYVKLSHFSIFMKNTWNRILLTVRALLSPWGII